MKYFLTIGIIFFISVFCQAQSQNKVGVNTRFPAQLFHVDPLKNNTSVTPNTIESFDDFVITSDGNVGVGVINPTKKLEINSGLDNVSGLRFSNLNSSSPVNTTASYIGLDSQGNVIKQPNPQKGVFNEKRISDTSNFTFNVIGGDLFDVNNAIITTGYTKIPSSVISVIDGKRNGIYFVNYSFSADVSSASGGASFYECRVFIDNKPTTAVQTLKEYESGGSVQFSINYTTQLALEGNHTFDIRLKRVQNSGAETNATAVSFVNFSLVGGVSELTFN